MLITYGHPEKMPMRRFKSVREIYLDFTQLNSFGYADSILEESEEPIGD